MNSLLLFILGLSAFTCLAQLIRQRRQVVLCRILAGLTAIGLLAFILAEENQDHPAPHPLGDSFSIVAAGGQGEFDRLQIVVRDCFGLLVAREIAVSAKTQVVTVPLGKLGKIHWAMIPIRGYCSYPDFSMPRFHTSWGRLIGGDFKRMNSYPDHLWQAQSLIVGSDIMANKVQIYYRPFHSNAITGSQNLGELIASLPEIPEHGYMPRKRDSAIRAEINGTSDRSPWAQLPVKEIVFAALFLCLALPWRFPVTFPAALLLILASLVIQEKLSCHSSLADFAKHQPMLKRIAALRDLNLTRFHGFPIVHRSSASWYEKSHFHGWQLDGRLNENDDPIARTPEYQAFEQIVRDLHWRKTWYEYEPE
jgi:hypothetical protein